MKRFVLLFIIISLAWTVSLVSCVNNSLPIPDTEIDETPNISDTSTPLPDTSDVTEIINIVDLTLNGDILTADALEGFYTDGTHDYYFSSIKSQYIIVEFSDGTTMNVKEAFERELITIADLDRFNIGYFVEIKDNGMEVVSIIDRTVTEMIPTDSALELFWQDEFCDYYFPSIRSEYVVVELLNGDSYYVNEALECGLITIKDLDKYNIQYIPYDKEDFFNISEFYLPKDTVRGLGEKFYEDDKFEYHYAYFSTDPIMSDTYVNYAYVREGFGDTESVSEALAKDHITLADLDKYDVEYIKIPKNNSSATKVNYNLGGDTVLIWDSDIEIYQLFEHSSKMMASLYGNLSLFTDYNEFSQFIKIFEENIKFYHDVFNTWDEAVPFEALISKYTEEWFDNNSLIIIHYSQGHYIRSRDISISLDKDIAKDGGDIMTVNIDTLNFGPDLGVDWFLCIEFNKTDVEKCTEFRLIINELPSLSD